MFDDAWLTDLLLDRGGMLGDPELARELAATLATRDPAADGGGIASRALLDALDQTWERGWQPADVVHTARRAATAGSVSLVLDLIGEHARRTDASSRAPDAWLAQLRELGVVAPHDPDVVAAWHRAERRPPAEAWRIILLLTGFLRTAVRIDALVPPPSRWGPPRARSAPTAAGDDRALRRIRGLLAKAESTEFPDEAESLTAKAQELMTRHAVDAALLDAGPSRSGGAAVGTRRMHVQDPYVRAKMQLLAAVAEANDVQLIWYRSLGIANLVGVPSDADAVELLFTSLLLQVAQALGAAERTTGRGSAARTFRRSFLLGYAHRIRERLTAARERATAEAAAEAMTAHGVDLLPVLRSRQAAVQERVAELFPRVRASRSRSSVDAGGWYAGRAAAERADVGHRARSLR